MMMTWLDWLIGIAALLTLLPFLDRVRVLEWRRHLWRVIGQHLLCALWLGGTAYGALIEHDAHWSVLLGIGAAALWIASSYTTWRHGPPPYAESDRAPLDGGPPASPPTGPPEPSWWKTWPTLRDPWDDRPHHHHGPPPPPP